MTNPTPAERDPARFNSAIRQLYAGGSNNTGVVTLRANQTTTVVNHQSCNPNSHISVMPITENALKAFLPTPKIYQATRVLSAASGNVAYTGLGFKPSFIQFQLAAIGGNIWGSIGQSDGVLNTSLTTQVGTTLSEYYQNTIAGFASDNASGSSNQQFTLASFDLDGFTLAWVKAGTPTATFNMTAICYPETGIRVSSRTTGSFTLTHSSNAAVDQTVTYSITGGA
jgi:hypothetical protein